MICRSNEIDERRVMGIIQRLVNMGRRIGVKSDPGMIKDRSDSRNLCLIASEFGYFGNVHSALIRNLNRSGAFIETKKNFRVGQAIWLKFPLHYLDPPVEVTGVIAWTGSDGVGVKFDPMDG